MTAYYNEFDPFAAEWLRQLIKAGVIADGIVDDRSILDVEPEDLKGFTQCHFFAGIGTWSYALRQAGWADGRPVWTGSPPCQPFSNAGQRKGKDDDRHLAPHWLDLVSECSPPVVFGEQVEAAIRHDWLDDLQTHLEAEDYACGAIVLPACGIGAPHIRQRLWFVAERLGDADSIRQSAPRVNKTLKKTIQPSEGETLRATSLLLFGGVGNTKQQQLRRDAGTGAEAEGGITVQPECDITGSPGTTDRPSPINGFWRDPDWLFCRDGKWRPVESGTFPLVSGAAARVGRLRGYGNGIVAPLAQTFIESYMECAR